MCLRMMREKKGKADEVVVKVVVSSRSQALPKPVY